MAGRKWVPPFAARRPAPPPPPGPGKPGLLARLVAAAQAWQVIAAALAALAGLWVWVSDQELKRLEVNRQAVAAASAPERRAAFWTDARPMLAALEPLFPRHGTCAAYGVYLTEWARAERVLAGGLPDPGGASSIEAVTDSGRAVSERLAAIAAEIGLDLAPQKIAAERIGFAGGDCAPLRAELPLLARVTGAGECRGLLDSYLQQMCRRAGDQAMATTRAAALSAAAQGALRAQAHAAATLPAATSAAGAAEACADVGPMLVYVQYLDRADRAAALAVTQALRARGWTLNAPLLVDDQTVTGEVRYYHANQRRCGDALAADVSAVWPPGRPMPPLRVFELDDEGTPLPIRRMELWLPDL